jgi:hypothetical protein
MNLIFVLLLLAIEALILANSLHTNFQIKQTLLSKGKFNPIIMFKFIPFYTVFPFLFIHIPIVVTVCK